MVGIFSSGDTTHFGVADLLQASYRATANEGYSRIVIRMFEPKQGAFTASYRCTRKNEGGESHDDLHQT
jgi:hypothetical protein